MGLSTLPKPSPPGGITHEVDPVFPLRLPGYAEQVAWRFRSSPLASTRQVVAARPDFFEHARREAFQW